MFLSLQCLATLIIMLVGDTYTLINYVSFINYLCYGVTIIGLIVLRWKKPKIFRPIKVTLSELNVLVAMGGVGAPPRPCPRVPSVYQKGTQAHLL